MRYASFLSSLLETGRVRVTGLRELTEDELRAGDLVLCAFEEQYRREMPDQPPPLEVRAARWAAVLFFRACQFAVYRDVPAQVIDEELSATNWGECLRPARPSPAVHYSVDLVFRLLPDLTRFARSAAEADPLVAHLKRLGREWPLSSVGMSDVGPVDVGGFIDDPSLRALYADRIISTRDVSRLADPRVRDAVQQALGLHAELSPQLSEALKQHEVPEPT